MQRGYALLMPPACHNMILLLPFFSVAQSPFSENSLHFNGQTENDDNMSHLHMMNFDELHFFFF